MILSGRGLIGSIGSSIQPVQVPKPGLYLADNPHGIFYANCHQVFRPDLRGKPVVVLSNNDGFVVARSKEAKTLVHAPAVHLPGIHHALVGYPGRAGLTGRVSILLKETKAGPRIPDCRCAGCSLRG